MAWTRTALALIGNGVLAVADADEPPRKLDFAHRHERSSARPLFGYLLY